ncbi:hypothetical protein [Aestuariivirga sp.]|uniref:hypothetical protein n=1 Tax=Aestuariivirga sp. TaxID=2650926 RepID=UPI003BAD6794
MNTDTLTKPEHREERRPKASQGQAKPKRMRWGPKPSQYRLKPFQQGHLDPLCGEYAIVNALRLLTRPNDGLDKLFWEDLFGYVMSRADRLFGIRRILDDGTPPWLNKALLPMVLKRFEAGAGFSVETLTLSQVGESNHKTDPMAALQAALADRRAAALVLLGGGYHHWTVVRAVTPRAVWLFDSDGLKSLLRSDIAPSYLRQEGRRFVVSQRPIRVLRRL